MVHVLVLHAPTEAQTAGAVAAVLSDMTAFRTEVSPGRRAFRYGAEVVPIVVWSPGSLGPGLAEAMADTLAGAQRRAVAIVFGGAELPELIAEKVGRVVLESPDSAADQASLRAAIHDMSSAAAAVLPRSAASATNLAQPTRGQASSEAASLPARIPSRQIAKTAKAENRPRTGWPLPLSVGIVLGVAAGVVGMGLFDTIQAVADDARAGINLPKVAIGPMSATQTRAAADVPATPPAPASTAPQMTAGLIPDSELAAATPAVAPSILKTTPAAATSPVLASPTPATGAALNGAADAPTSEDPGTRPAGARPDGAKPAQDPLDEMTAEEPAIVSVPPSEIGRPGLPSTSE